MIHLATEEGGNIFLTGKAGTGKSWTNRRIVSRFNIAEGKTIYVTASTGIAAINVGGITVNKFGGFGLGEDYSDFDRVMDKKVMHKIQKVRLLIDEISMLDGHLFDVLECMISIIRNYHAVKERIKEIKEMIVGQVGTEGNSIMSQLMLDMRCKILADIRPWGGLQLIAVGDFFQLPPIPNSSTSPVLNNDFLSLWDEKRELKIGRQ